MKVVIAGGSGLIGRRIATSLLARRDDVVVLSRRPAQQRQLIDGGIHVEAWDATDATRSWAKHLHGADAVINLAGQSVGSWPWTRGQMLNLVNSRIDATNALVGAITASPATERPKVLINASGTDLYEGNDAEPATEDARPASTFLALLCRQWEAAARPVLDAGVRLVLPRMSLVVARDAPALRRLCLPVRFFAGGKLGSGEQWISWIHISDVVGLLLAALDRNDMSGPVNFASPDPRRQADFSRAIARTLQRPFWLPTPAIAIRLALGAQATLALGSRRVSGARVLALGYRFSEPQLEGALERELAKR